MQHGDSRAGYRMIGRSWPEDAGWGDEFQAKGSTYGEDGGGGARGSWGRTEPGQELLLKPLGVKRRSLVFIPKSMGSIEEF